MGIGEGAKIGSVFGPLGMIAGAAVGALIMASAMSNSGPSIPRSGGGGSSGRGRSSGSGRSNQDSRSNQGNNGQTPRGNGENPRIVSETNEDGERRIEFEFEVTGETIRNGPAIPQNIREIILGQGVAGDHTGHLQARMFFGAPSLLNLVPIRGDVNNGPMKSVEKEVQSAVRNNPGSTAKVTIILVFRNRNYPNRPDWIGYKYTLYDRHGNVIDTNFMNDQIVWLNNEIP